jgi:hypothetical protein
LAIFAACSELEIEESDPLFFAGQGQSRLAIQARAICAACEVQGECLEFALRNPDETEYGCGAGLRRGNAGNCGDCLDDTRLTHKFEKERNPLITLEPSNQPLDQRKRSRWHRSRNDVKAHYQYYDTDSRGAGGGPAVVDGSSRRDLFADRLDL